MSDEEKQVEDWLRQAELFVEAIKLLAKTTDFFSKEISGGGG